MLVRGVDWSKGRPSLQGFEGNVDLALGRTLGFRVLDGRRHCLGFSRLSLAQAETKPGSPTAAGTATPPATSVEQVPCPQAALAERGYQCGACFARDDFRFMHDFHRSGVAPEGLRAYLAQPHWLYVASFANGAAKVGTASDLRKTVRLAEQGAVAAQYVAHAVDGRIVRLLEDAVSEGAGLPQLVRSANKLGSLTEPWQLETVAQHNAEQAARVREFLSGAALEGFQIVEQSFALPAQTAGFLSASAPQSYPIALDSGDHGLPLKALLGSFALLELDGSNFVANLGELKGRVIELGDFESELPAVQSSLF
ncbi:DUF2797 domain-containing protein [Psychromicrobium lacuslunae]|uniref:DUF2797 domain-containing protein n=1 Tax=Psychromicrobium lacuslunae TaxID=1618207 RepID=A0A0D4BZR2_9MICC|nr:DUF2797 domain-containing protein [Psychromicrobium lacuslunae]AJT41804.1 hypothetical protein UM93_10230 [Psychromicrobium lacuslunae]